MGNCSSICCAKEEAHLQKVPNLEEIEAVLKQQALVTNDIHPDNDNLMPEKKLHVGPNKDVYYHEELARDVPMSTEDRNNQTKETLATLQREPIESSKEKLNFMTQSNTDTKPIAKAASKEGKLSLKGTGSQEKRPEEHIVLEEKRQESYENSNKSHETNKRSNPQMMPVTTTENVMDAETLKLIQSTIGTNKRTQLPPIHLETGAVYVGQWLNGERDGLGVQSWPDGSRYEGEWKNNKASGHGKLTHSDGDTYEGGWADDMANGHGFYSHSNGARFEGHWKNDKQDGHGVETWPDGAKYIGQYKDGKKQGKGELYFADGSVYKGDFTDNDITGYGIYTWKDGKVYEGFWKKNKMHGKGKLRWADGRVYEGEYMEDKKHGPGVFIWADGKKYIGKWVNGKQHGRGEYYDGSGAKRVGEWSEGKRIRWLDS